METQKDEDRETFWRQQLEAASARTGTLEEFCRERGISMSTYQNWKRRLSGKVRREMRAVPFVPVHVVSEPQRQQSAIDPCWLAMFIRSLHEER